MVEFRTAVLSYDVAKFDAEIAADRQREAALGLSFSENKTESKQEQKEPENE